MHYLRETSDYHPEGYPISLVIKNLNPELVSLSTPLAKPLNT
jgi:hypothetical protein